MEIYSTFLLLAIISYLLGSIPSGLILAKLLKKNDPRSIGSYSIGATNMVRTAGKMVGFFTLILDVAKASVTTYLVLKYHSMECAIVAGYLAVVGHMFSIYLKFKGGKGIASNLGILYILDINAAIIMSISWILSFITIKISAAASLISISCTTVYIILLSEQGILIPQIVLTLLIIFKHRSNVSKIIAGEA